jgi:hypothetical protein
MQRDRIPKLLKLQTAGKKKQRTTGEVTPGRRGRNGSMNGLTPRMFDDDEQCLKLMFVKAECCVLFEVRTEFF